jgi:uncharacterized membrane protein
MAANTPGGPTSGMTPAGDAREALATELSLSRLFTYSDAVVSIAATILITVVLTLQPPKPGEAFWQSFFEQGGLISLLAFGLSFAFVMHSWRNNLAMTDGLRTNTSALLTLNSFWLVGIAFLPFPTYWFAESSSVDPRAEFSFYLLCVAVVGLFGRIEAEYLQRHPELFTTPRKERTTQRALGAAYVGWLVLAALLVSVLPGNLGLPVLVAGLLTLTVLRRWEQRRARRQAGASGVAEPEPSSESVTRVVLFSDAVVAIAATLLILPLLDLDSPASDQTLASALAAGMGPILAFLAGFALITLQWRIHRTILHGRRSYTPRLLTINAWWLASIVFLPLPTEWIGTDNSSPRVVALMWAAQSIVGLCGLALWYYLRRHPRMTATVRPGQSKGQAVVLLCMCLYGLFVAGVYTQVDVGSNWTLLVLGLAVIALVGRRLQGSGPRQPMI